MKENIFYWIRVLVLVGILLFILMSCTAWAQPVSGIPFQTISEQVKAGLTPEKYDPCMRGYAWSGSVAHEFPVSRQSTR